MTRAQPTDFATLRSECLLLTVSTLWLCQAVVAPAAPSFLAPLQRRDQYEHDRDDPLERFDFGRETQRTPIHETATNVVDVELFFAASNDLYAQFEYALGPERVLTDMHASHLLDGLDHRRS